MLCYHQALWNHLRYTMNKKTKTVQGGRVQRLLGAHSSNGLLRSPSCTINHSMDAHKCTRQCLRLVQVSLWSQIATLKCVRTSTAPRQETNNSCQLLHHLLHLSSSSASSSLWYERHFNLPPPHLCYQALPLSSLLSSSAELESVIDKSHGAVLSRKKECGWLAERQKTDRGRNKGQTDGQTDRRSTKRGCTLKTVAPQSRRKSAGAGRERTRQRTS